MGSSTEVGQAGEWYKLGADFADAVHLCICASVAKACCTHSMVNFARRPAKQALPQHSNS